MKSPTTNTPVAPGNYELRFIFEDDHLFVIDKPAGTHSVIVARGGGVSVAELLLSRRPSLVSAGKKGADAGLINRLDRETSGILIGAKSPGVWHALRASLNAGEMLKRYLAVCDGKFEDAMHVESYIGSPYRRAKKVRVYTSAPPRRARALKAATDFRRLAYIKAGDVSLVEAYAPSARRHQIRAHAGFTSHPLTGDALYGSPHLLAKALNLDDLNEVLPAFFLHAWKVSFKHPLSGEQVSVAAPMPEPFGDALESYIESEKASRR